MVFSRLPDCNDLVYPELSRLEVEDEDYTTDAYELEIKGETVVIAFGKIKREFENTPYGVVYYPIYLVNRHNHEVVRKIGVIEYFAKDESRFNDTMDLDIEATPFRPLIFSYITVAMLREANVGSADLVKAKGKAAAKRKMQEPKAIETPERVMNLANDQSDVTQFAEAKQTVVSVNDDEDRDDDDDVEGSSDKGDVAEARGVGISDVALPTQTKALADKERAEYKTAGIKPGQQKIWIQTFMKNRHFGIEDNEGGTDSLFASIRDGLLSQGSMTDLTIEKMRVKLAEMATPELFNEYIKHYNKYVAQYKHNLAELTRRKKEIDTIKEERLQGKHLSSPELTKVKHEIAKLTAEQDEIQDRVDYLKDVVYRHYGYMKHTENKFQNFKTILSTRSFVPDAWALRALERAYNISIIRMSETRFKDDDLDNVIMCGDRIDDSPGLGMDMVTSNYKPILFIMLSVGDKDQYQLIRYHAKGSFAFPELQYDVRTHILTKCIENPDVEFATIPQFKRLLEIYPAHQRSGGGQNQSGGGGKHRAHGVDADDNYGGDDDKMSGSRDVPIFQFYNRSGNDFPGKGGGEYVPASMRHLFTPLSKITNWRRALSNFSESPFIMDGHTWFSVEHYYQGPKFRKQNRDFYLQFAMDSKSEISKDAAIAKAAGSKSGILNGRLYRPKSITVDNDFFTSGRGKQVLMEGLDAKFRQNTKMKNILLGTLNARLYHFQRGEKPILFTALMQTRSKLAV
jgi:predicted NAD-dependent protein-ADP-ribosyltransferase YbiA (DUF1768 family)